MTTAEYVKLHDDALYGPDSVFSAEEQDAMRRGCTHARRIAESGRVFGGFPQAISQDHADRLRAASIDLDRKVAAAILPQVHSLCPALSAKASH